MSEESPCLLNNYKIATFLDSFYKKLRDEGLGQGKVWEEISQ